MMDLKHVEDLADLKARMKAIEDDRLPERIGALERFQSVMSTGIFLIGVLIGALRDQIMTLFHIK